MIDLFIFLFLVFLFLALVFILDIIIFRHSLPTTNKAIKKLKEIIDKYAPRALNFYDLGCAHGDLAIKIKKYFPEIEVYGIDKNPIRIFFAKLKSLILGQKVHFIYKNIFALDLSRADIIYTYLWYDLMPKLEKKLKRELKKGAVVITNTSHFLNWEPEGIIRVHQGLQNSDFEKLFIYKKQ